MQAPGHLLAAHLHRADGPVPDAQVGARARFERADLVGQTERMRRPPRGRMQGLPGGQALPGHRLHLVGIGQRALHRQAGAAADVAGDADRHAGRLGGAPIEQAAAQKQIGRRAVRDLRAGLRQRLPVGVVEPDAVRQHAARAQKPGGGVDIEVAACGGEQLAHPLHLGPVLGHMRLHVDARVRRAQRAGHRQLSRRAGGCEAHRHRISEPVDAVPARDQLDTVAFSLRRIVEQFGRRMAVHQHLAGDQPHAARLRGGEEKVDAVPVHGRKHHRAGGAVRQQRVEEALGAALRMQRIGQPRLGREGVRVQPVEQLGAVAGDHVELRAVHVRVDEAGQDQPAAVVVLHMVGRRRLRARLCAADATVLDQQPVIGPEAHRRRLGRAPFGGRGEVEQVATQRQPPRRRGSDGHERRRESFGLRAEVFALGAARRIHAAFFLAASGGAGGANPTRPCATSRTCSRSQRIGAAAWLRSCHNW